VRVLVTGGAGYIGSHGAKALAAAGHDPIVIDDLRTGHPDFVRWGRLVKVDLTAHGAAAGVFASHAPEAVVHFAASAYVGESMRHPGAYFRNNVVPAMGLLDASVAAGNVPFVFSSSCATYGIPSRTPIVEDEPQAPVNPYGESKLMVEKMLRWYGDIHGLPWMALRYFNAAGADPDGEVGEDHDPETHIVPLSILALLGRDPVRVFGTDYPTVDGTAVRDYVHVTDLASAHVKAVESLVGGGDSMALNLGTGSGTTVRQVIDAVGRIAGGEVPRIAAPRRPGDPPVLVADASPAREVLQWEPGLSDIDTIARTAWQWHSRRHRT
jgi:UDP-arabinose 4-epimerase